MQKPFLLYLLKLKHSVFVALVRPRADQDCAEVPEGPESYTASRRNRNRHSGASEMVSFFSQDLSPTASAFFVGLVKVSFVTNSRIGPPLLQIEPFRRWGRVKMKIAYNLTSSALTLWNSVSF